MPRDNERSMRLVPNYDRTSAGDVLADRVSSLRVPSCGFVDRP